MAELERTLTLTQLTFYGVGTMIGAGIYSVIGEAAGEAQGQLWISFLFAGVAALLTALSYAEMSSMFPKAGAEYQYLKESFPAARLLPFMAGYLIALSAAATSATVALAFAGYLAVFAEWPEFAIAFGLLVFCTLVNIAGIRQSTWASIGMICVEISGLLLIIWAGFMYGAISNSFGDGFSGGGNSGGLTGIFAATSLVFFIFMGFEDVANLSEEAKEPKRDIPRALIISVVTTSVIYVLVALSVLALASPDELAASNTPLTLAAGKAAPWMGQALAVIALFATASTALITLISISRLLFGMARDGDMPLLLKHTLSGRKTPWVAALALFGAACVLLPLGEVKTVASVSSFSVLLVFIAVQAGLIALRLREPGKKRGFMVPLTVGRVPVLPVMGIIICLSLLTQFEPIVYAVSLGALVLGALIYAVKTVKAGASA